MKNTKMITWGIVVLFFIIIFWSGCGKYNFMVNSDEGITAQWKNVQIAYQARNY